MTAKRQYQIETDTMLPLSTMTMGELTYLMRSKFTPDYRRVMVRKEMSKRDRRARNQAMSDLGLTKVRGALGGTYWE